MLKIIQFFAKFGNVIEMAAVIRKKRDPGENIAGFGTVLYIKKPGILLEMNREITGNFKMENRWSPWCSNSSKREGSRRATRLFFRPSLVRHFDEVTLKKVRHLNFFRHFFPAIFVSKTLKNVNTEKQLIVKKLKITISPTPLIFFSK